VPGLPLKVYDYGYQPLVQVGLPLTCTWLPYLNEQRLEKHNPSAQNNIIIQHLLTILIIAVIDVAPTRGHTVAKAHKMECNRI